ncbi:hypothetical protein NL676_017341 [Syzygium grande]|nr:hypothetical protein NL676_017341 [Syzygium grande]
MILPIPAPFPSRRLLLLLLLLVLSPLTIAKFWNGPSSVSVPASWTASEPYDFNLANAGIKAVLCRLNSGPSFLYGFICYDGSLCYFGLFVFQPTQDMKNIMPALVYSVSPEPMRTAQMLLTKEGDLVLLGDDGNKIWSTDTAGESAVGATSRMKLTATSSTQDGTAPVYTFTTDDQTGFVASVSAAHSSQIYYKTSNVSKMKSHNGQVEALYKNGTFGEFELPLTSLAQFITLGKDGHLRHYIYDEHPYSWNPMDLLQNQIDNCNYPLVCGSYGICSSVSGCACPMETKQIEATAPSSGCNRSSPFSCDSHHNTFVEVENVTFFALWNDYISANISNTTAESCKEACLRKGCSCTMALFRNQTIFSGGDCYLLSEPFSLIDDHSGDLKSMTGDFNIKLGEGGFGSVFLGTLPNGTRIAVKRLHGFAQIKKSFLAEAGTIGTIHHVNLRMTVVTRGDKETHYLEEKRVS